MAIETQQFIRKPLFVEAVQVSAENFVEVCEWCQGEVRTSNGDEPVSDPGINPSATYIRVRVHNPKNTRQTKAFVGDWILYTERGYKVYTQKAFKASFDLAEPEKVAI
jgi:hypothetical protein